MYVTKNVEAPETLESFGSFKVSASVSEAATSRLGLVSDFKRLVSVSSRTKFWRSRSRLGLGDMGLGSRLGFGSEGLVHIPDTNIFEQVNI